LYFYFKNCIITLINFGKGVNMKDAYKKILLGTVVSLLALCLFFSFGFQIDVSAGVSKTGGTAEVSLIDPLRVAAEEANAAVKAAQLALEEALAAQAVVQAIAANPATALSEAQAAVDAAQATLDLQTPGTPEYVAAQLALEEALAAQAFVQAVAADTATALSEAQAAVDEAQAALEAAILAAEGANAAYSGVKILDEEELAELQLAVDEAQAALDEAKANGADEETLAELQEELDKAIAALEGGESGVGGSMFFHVITNSNNGGYFDKEGNYSGQDGEIIPYTFTAEEGFELAWLRVGNIKIPASELESLFDFSFDKKNLTIHAHFKKVKDYSPELTTTEGTGTGEDGDPLGDEEDEKGNGKGKGKGKGNDNGNGKGKEKDKKPKKNK
jgi:hypothetical protein